MEESGIKVPGFILYIFVITDDLSDFDIFFARINNSISFLQFTNKLYFSKFQQGTVPRSDLPGRPLELYMCSVLKRQGYGEGFRWLAQYID